MFRALACTITLLAACGSVEGDPADGGPDAAPPDAPSADATIDQTVSWQATDGLPEDACAPWELVHNPAPERPTLDGGGFLVIATDQAGDQLFYRQGADVLAPPADGKLVIEARMRLVSGTTVGARSPVHIGFVIAGKSNVLFLTDTGMFLLEDPGHIDEPPVTDLPPDGAFHDYRIEADLDAAAGTDNVRVLRDDKLVLTGHTSAEPERENVIFFGDSTQAAAGTGDYAAVRHNAHVADACP
jgi:hypothetical protein